MIQRRLTQELKELSAQFPVVVILGPRQVGKTTLVKQVSTSLNKQTLYLDLEDPDDLAILEKNPGAFLAQNQEKCIIIDEVQRFPAIFPRLRPIIDNYKKPGRFILLGSANPILLQGSAESLAGRAVYMELPPLHLLEIDLAKEMFSLWYQGGFPDPFLSKKNKFVRNWHKAFLSTFFERELPLLGLNASPTILSRYLTMLAHMQGQLGSLSTLSKSLGVDRRVLERIKQFFIGSYLLRELPPFHVNSKKRLIKTPKYYIRDSGIFHHILHIKSLNELWSHVSLGASWESFVIEQICNLGLDIFPYFYRTRAGSECDLVLVEGNTPLVSIEAKVRENPSITRSLQESITDLGTTKNYIVTPSCKTSYELQGNVTVCSLPQLLATLSKMIS